MLAWPPKDPDEVLDYSIDWSEVLAEDEDTIDDVVWSFPAGITKDSQSEDGGLATVWISGGTAGIKYEIGCRMVTAGLRTYDRTVSLSVRQA